jgi:hypothetical protein
MSVDIVGENLLPGTYTREQMQPDPPQGDMTVPGFARQISVNVGETIEFSVHGPSTEILIFRAGWYGGTHQFRQVDSIVNTPTTQPEATVVPNSYGATTATGWSVTASWTVPVGAVSGMYTAMVRNAAETNAFNIPFVVRDDDAQADIIYKTSDTTWGAAYNHWGTIAAPNGRNLYGSGTGVGNIMERSAMVSYHRPVITRGTVMQTYWWACELPLVVWLERNGFTVKYIASVDLDREGADILRTGKIFLSSGHDEYWTEAMRDAVEEWRDLDGGYSIFMSGNEVFWKARFEYIGDEARLWCYKDTMPGPTVALPRNAGEPLDPVAWTGTWKDTRWPGRRPEWLLTGTDFGMNGVYDYNATVPSNPYGGLPQWGMSSLVDADIVFLEALGFEADHVHPTQPIGSYVYLARYTRTAPGGLSDANGERYDVQGNIEWGIVSQRYRSGAITIGFGTCQWSWLLSNKHDRGLGNAESREAQQFILNILRDLGAEPGSKQANLTLGVVNSPDAYGQVPQDYPMLILSNKDGDLVTTGGGVDVILTSID